MSKISVCLIHVLLVLISTKVSSQSDSSTLSPPPDSLHYDFILIDTKIQNQFAFLGRDFGTNIPVSSVTLAYYFHTNIWIGASAFYFFDDFIPLQTGITLGYYKEFSPHLDLHLSYSQFYIPDKDIPSASKSQGYFQSTLGLDWGLLYSTIQPQLIIRKNGDLFITSAHSRYFEFNGRLFKKIKVSFEPRFAFTFGTHHFDYADGIVVGPGGGAVAVPNEEKDLGKKIVPLNWDFTFPLKFEEGKATIEFSWRYSSPLNIASSDVSEPAHFFAASIGYYIPIAK